MCGRYALSVEREALLAYFGEGQLAWDFDVQYNVAPGQYIPAVIAHQGQLRFGKLKWGLVPSWAKDDKLAAKLVNARAETLADKPSFRDSLRRKRCVIPADSFYEWHKQADGSKQPMRIHLKDSPVFAMAGLYDTWVQPDGEKLHTCTIITTEANPVMADIHHRMPAILPREQLMSWLDPAVQEPDRLLPLLQPYPEQEMTAYAVTSVVNSVRNNSPDCFAPAGTA